jgi:protoporphyrinogen oxidase
LEYFCSEGDKLWEKSDEDLAEFAIDELATIDIIDNKEILDFVVIRVPKTYPAYFRAYKQFSEIRDFTDNIDNLFLVGRNGMHRYNNMDHSMMTAMLSVDNIIENIKTKGNIWEVNIEEQYHEEA